MTIRRDRVTVDRRRIKGGDLDPVYVSGGSVNIAAGDNGLFDAFGRLRAALPFTIFDSKQIFNDPEISNTIENFPILFDNQEVSGSGTSTLFNVNRASTTLSVSANTAGRRVRQTKRRFNYQPSKSQSLVVTFANLQTTSGITKRLGYYDDYNGVFLQSANGVAAVGIRSNVTGSPVDTLITQDDWNVDTLQGTGISDTTIDISNAQVFTIDMEWLGVGRVRYGFFLNGVPIYVHYADNANSTSSVYMSTPNNPVRVEIINDGSGAASSVEHICTAVISDGGVQPNGIHRSPPPATVAATTINANTVGTTYVVAGIRLKDSHLGAEVVPRLISMLATTTDDYLWSIHLNPVLSTALTWTNIEHSAVQYAYGPTTNPGTTVDQPGYTLDSGFVSTSIEAIQTDVATDFRLGADINGLPDELILAATPLAINLDILGLITWREVW